MPDYLVETHAHTDTVSQCGRLSPRELVEGCVRAGYSALVVTDHLTSTLPVFRGATTWREKVRRFFAGYRAAAREGSRRGLSVLPGFELSLSGVPGSDFLVYGIDEPALSRMGDVCSMSLPAFASLARSAGALVFQAHPFRGGARPVRRSWIDGVEVYNGNPRHFSDNERAAAFAAQHGLLAISGSDAHQEEDIGRGGITLPRLPETVKDLVRWYREAPHRIGLLAAVPATPGGGALVARGGPVPGRPAPGEATVTASRPA